MRRALPIAVLLLPLLGLVWSTARVDPLSFNPWVDVADMTASVPPAELRALGPFVLERAWRLTGHDQRFGGYSALVLQPGGLLAISDRNRALPLRLPMAQGAMKLQMPRLISQHWPDGRGYVGFDTESAVRDPSDGSLWIGLEDDPRVVRADARSGTARLLIVPETRDWPANGGVEAMARLNDGRWIMLCESCGTGPGGLHLGLLFASQPARSPSQKFGITVPAGFDPVDAATLPDGRVLILVRRLALFPPHFEARLVLADFAAFDPRRPLATRELGRIDGPVLRENWEGMVLAPAGDHLDLWLVSDANDAALQETRLLQLRLDTAALPAP